MSNKVLNYDEGEDEAVVGSELHKILSSMGYSDYETLPAVSTMNQEVSTSGNELKQKCSIFGILYSKIFSISQFLLKDIESSRKQVTMISKAPYLLDEHLETIKNLLTENSDTEITFSKSNQFLSYLQYATVATLGYYLVDRSDPLTWIFALPALTTARYKYTKWRRIRNLKRLISEQTELRYGYKRLLRILNHSFGMKSGAQNTGSKFSDIGVDKLKFLQPTMEKMIKSLEIMSIVYYKTNLKIAEFFSDSFRRDVNYEITYFEEDSFINCGEITCKSLKQFFYKFILVQSEMIFSLALLRFSNADNILDEIKRGITIDRTIEKILELTNVNRILITRIVDDFQKHKLVTTENKYRSRFAGSKWQDLYLRLNLASQKMEKTYDNINWILKEIDNHIEKRTEEKELMIKLKTRLEEACNDADKIRDLTLLSALIIAKMSRTNFKDKDLNSVDNEDDIDVVESNITAIKDSEDRIIIDEVFEEYIRERYSETLLNNDGDNYFDKTYKLDKLLSKNLMSELKVVLIDKQKDTEARESQALKRMKKDKNIKEEEEEEEEVTEIEINDLEVELKPECMEEPKLNGIPIPPLPPPLIPKLIEFNESNKELKNVKDSEESRSKYFVPLSNCDSNKLPLFLSNNEETFIGSGENSEEEEEEEEEVKLEEENEDEEKEISNS